MAEKFYRFIANLPQDKKDHALTLPLVAFAVMLAGPRHLATLWAAISISFIVALSKELSDLQDPRHRFELLDIAWGMGGCVLPALLYWRLL